MKNLKELYGAISEDELTEKLKKLYKEIIGYSNTGYTQNLVLNEDGSLEIYRMGQNETLQSEFNGKAFTLCSFAEFDITDIEGWEIENNSDVTEDELLECYLSENFSDFYDQTVEDIEEKVYQWDTMNKLNY